jgi:hypothetical protein
MVLLNYACVLSVVIINIEREARAVTNILVFPLRKTSFSHDFMGTGNREADQSSPASAEVQQK